MTVYNEVEEAGRGKALDGLNEFLLPIDDVGNLLHRHIDNDECLLSFMLGCIHHDLHILHARAGRKQFLGFWPLSLSLERSNERT